jgi:hypothetical protein
VTATRPIARECLPNRRASTTFGFECGPHCYFATISHFPTGELAEIFLGSSRAGSDIDAAAKDSAVVASIALQFGVPVNVIRKALLRDSEGIASSPLGALLDLVVSEQEGMR